MKKLLSLILCLGFFSCGVAFGQISGISNNVSCNGGNNGSIIINNTAGLNSPITYYLDQTDSNATGNFSNLMAGIYTVTASDATNTSFSQTFTITEPTAIQLSIDSIENVSCFGNCDGYIKLNAIGGVGTVIFSTAPSLGTAASGIYSNLCANTYTCTVTDANGCNNTAMATITQPSSGFTQIIDSTFQPNCGDTSGFIKLSINGTGSFTSSIQPNVGTQPSAHTFSNLAQGAYTITTTDNNACSNSTVVALNANNNLSFNYLNATYPTCYNGTDGTITTLASGGTNPVTYSIVNTSYPNNTTGQFSGINSGFYTIKASDANGCVKNTSLNIFNPSPIVVTPMRYAPSCNNSNGAVKLISNSNYGPSTYSILPTATAVGIDSFAGLSYGTYTVSVQDAIGCSNTQSFTMSKATAYAQNTQLNDCFGDNNGELTVITTANFNYFNPAVLQPGNITSTNGIFNGLSGGITYSIYLNDGNGCLDTISANVYEPPAFNIAIDSLLLPSSPTTTDAYLRIQPISSATYLLANGSWQQLNTTGIFNNIPAGTYTLKVKRFNCELDTTINLQHPNCSLSFTNVITQASSCSQNNGSIQLGVANANGSLTFLNNSVSLSTNPALFSNLNINPQLITVTDSLGCSIDTTILTGSSSTSPIINAIVTQDLPCFNNGSGSVQVIGSGGSGTLDYSLIGTSQQNTTGIFNNLAIGNYTVQVKDDSLCQSAINTFSIQNGNNFNPTILSTPSSCNTNCDGMIELFTSSNSNYIPQVDSFKLGTVVNTTGVFNTLCAANYPITIYYDNSCIKTVNSNVVQSSFQIVGVNKTDPTCAIGNDGSLSINVVNGTPPYQYSLNGGAYQTVSAFNNLVGGTYTVTVKDALNCATASSIVSLNTTALIVNATVTTPSCVPGCDGSVILNVQGGTSPLSYSLSSFANNQSSNQFFNICPGIYTATVTDMNGCTGTSSVQILAPTAPIINNVQVTNVSCNGGNDGSINYTTTGTAPLFFTLTPQSSQSLYPPFTNLSAGTYIITATDALGCFSTQSVTVLQSPAITVNPSPQAINLGNNTYGSTCGQFPYTVTGKLPIQITIYDSLNNLVTSFQKNNLDANNLQGFGNGQFKIIATDSCGSDSIYAIINSYNFIFDSIQVTDVSCAGGNNGTATIQSSGGQSPITYSLTPNIAPSAPGVFNNLAAGVYTVQATDINGCSIINTFTMNEPSPIVINQMITQDVTCHSDSTGSVAMNVTGGVGAYTYTLASSTYNTNSSNNLPAGNYTITIADANSCIATDTFTINQPLPINLSVVSIKDAKCSPNNSGEIEVAAAGGAGSIIYSIIPTFIPQLSPGVFENLPSGTYTITATDGNNCTATKAVIIEQANTPILAINNQGHESCQPGQDGYVTLGGVPEGNNYQFSKDSLNWSSNTNGRYFGNLEKGSYTFYIRDTATNCYASLAHSVEFDNNLTFGELSLMPPSCNGSSDASIRVGSGEYDYSIFPPAGVKSDSITFSGLKAGTYNIIGTDAKGCTGTRAALLINPDALSFKSLNQTTATNVHCYGTIQAEVIGGTPNYAYSINPKRGKQDSVGLFEGLCWTDYTVTARDKNGCTISQKVKIEVDDNASGNVFDYLKIFPNPANDFITLRFEYLVQYNVKMFDIFGNIVFEQDVYNKEQRINVSAFSAGMYILRFKSEVDIDETKIMISH